MINILIIEDEELAADRLESMLQKSIPSCNILAKIGSVDESVKWLFRYSADLIFLDIRLSDGLCFSIFDRVEVHTPVIFTTAYDQYAIEAFQLNSISYLLKPIRQRDLDESLEKFQSMKSVFNTDLRDIFKLINDEKRKYKHRFLIKVGNTLKTVQTKDIAYFYAMEKSVFLKTFSNKLLPVEMSLNELEKYLDPVKFFRINRQYIVNINSIQSMHSWSRSRIKIILKPTTGDDSETVVSINRSQDFKNWLDK
ncbi:MAG TPA: LytTR family DNA-binding domain-containing protein [Balneolaceae bacterium]|nr:LytTR family DNA-binding domain-containing protein [Balneolaceae bacterium]